jgi:hypothetical protein
MKTPDIGNLFLWLEYNLHNYSSNDLVARLQDLDMLFTSELSELEFCRRSKIPDNTKLNYQDLYTEFNHLIVQLTLGIVNSKYKL